MPACSFETRLKIKTNRSFELITKTYRRFSRLPCLLMLFLSHMPSHTALTLFLSGQFIACPFARSFSISIDVPLAKSVVTVKTGKRSHFSSAEREREREREREKGGNIERDRSAFSLRGKLPTRAWLQLWVHRHVVETNSTPATACP